MIFFKDQAATCGCVDCALHKAAQEASCTCSAICLGVLVHPSEKFPFLIPLNLLHGLDATLPRWKNTLLFEVKFEDIHSPYFLLLSQLAWLFKVNCKTQTHKRSVLEVTQRQNNSKVHGIMNTNFLIGKWEIF